MRDFPLPVGMTTSASLPPRTASIGSHWPGRKSLWPKRSVSSLRAASLLIFFGTLSVTGTKYSHDVYAYPTYPDGGRDITSFSDGRFCFFRPGNFCGYSPGPRIDRRGRAQGAWHKTEAGNRRRRVHRPPRTPLRF